MSFAPTYAWILGHSPCASINGKECIMRKKTTAADSGRRKPQAAPAPVAGMEAGGLCAQGTASTNPLWDGDGRQGPPGGAGPGTAPSQPSGSDPVPVAKVVSLPVADLRLHPAAEKVP